MLNALELNYFRQFENKRVVFNAGNTAIRGRNEGGKTTLIEAFFYAMGGTKCCRNNDFITWGAKKSACKVVAEMTLGGANLRVCRGPSGAEIYLNGDTSPAVTGQTEVTAFLEEQLGGIPLDLAYRMMFVEQGAIRGLLDAKPGEAVQTIEELAGLDIVDYFITRIQETGKVGSTAGLDERVAAWAQELEDKRAVSFAEGLATAERDVAAAQKTAEQLDAREQQLATAARELQTRLGEAAAVKQRLADADRRVSAAVARATELDTEVTSTQAQLSKMWSLAELEKNLASARQLVEESDLVAQKASHKRVFDGYTAPDLEWEGSVAELRAYIAERRTTAGKHRDAAIAAAHEAQLHAGKLISSSACGLCGKDVSELPEVAATNSKLNLLMADANDRAEKERALSEEVMQELRTAEQVMAQELPRILQTSPFVSRDEGFWPPRVSWIGGTWQELDAEEAKRELRTAEQKLANCQSLTQALGLAQQRLADARAAVETEHAVLNDAAEAASRLSEEGLEDRLVAANAAAQEARTAAVAANRELGMLQGSLAALRSAEANHARELEKLDAQLATAKAELDAIVFNNDLISALRVARPLVANKLWGMVLKAVSTYFTKMRGEASIVERVDKTFTVNGHPFSSLSGSAVDLLGLAIRVALVKVFVPGNDMLILDEPFSACDAARTQQCLAFTALAGFMQTIVITHEGDTEQVFDHLVTV